MKALFDELEEIQVHGRQPDPANKRITEVELVFKFVELFEVFPTEKFLSDLSCIPKTGDKDIFLDDYSEFPWIRKDEVNH